MSRLHYLALSIRNREKEAIGLLSVFVGLSAVQLTSPSGVAGHRGTPCDVPMKVRLGWPQGQRLAMLVS